jgi:hypothetical protein
MSVDIVVGILWGFAAGVLVGMWATLRDINNESQP